MKTNTKVQGHAKILAYELNKRLYIEEEKNRVIEKKESVDVSFLDESYASDPRYKEDLTGVTAGTLFLSLLQSEEPKIVPVMNYRNYGTERFGKTLNKGQGIEKKTSLSLSISDLGHVDIQVYEVGECVSLRLKMRDKSLLPQNPLLFKKIIESGLAVNIGKDVKLEFI